MRISDEVMTHAGRFHADDVFSAALLKIVKPEVKVKRVMHVPEDFDGIAFDIGGGRYDHHQKGAEVRESDMLMPHLGYCGEIWAQSLWAGKWQKSLIRDLLSH